MREKYPPQILERIRNSANLRTLIQKYTRLNHRNKGICPFHDDHNPSLSVNPQKGLWKCFGCNRGGDVFDFIMEAEHVSFPNAVKLLAFEVGVRLPESETLKKAMSVKWEKYNEEIFVNDCLNQAWEAFEHDIHIYFAFIMRASLERVELKEELPAVEAQPEEKKFTLYEVQEKRKKLIGQWKKEAEDELI